MAFTDQKQRVVTVEECALPFAGGTSGKRFRCYLCGHRFKPGDKWRWIFGQGKVVNQIVCEACDGPNEDVIERAIVLKNEFKSEKFWWYRKK